MFPPKFWKNNEDEAYSTLHDVYTRYGITKHSEVEELQEFIWFSLESAHLTEESRELILMALRDYSWVHENLNLQLFQDFLKTVYGEDIGIINLKHLEKDFHDYWSIQKVCNDLSGEYLNGVKAVGQYTMITSQLKGEI